MTSAPVGVFDSGVGGLSVAREIRARLPAESLLYFADTANCPYGGRPLDEIRSLSLEAARHLVNAGAKLIVIACNTASGAALEVLREELSVPIVGLEPAVKPAVRTSANRRVGVMATAATLRTERFDRLAENYAADIRLTTAACPGLVKLVEAGEVSGDRVRATLEEVLTPLKEAGVDTVVLGCTHYPFLRPAIREVLGPGVRIIDSGTAVARQVERVLTEWGALAEGEPGGFRLLTTGDAESVRRVAERLWGEPIEAYDQVRTSGGPLSADSSM